MNKITLLCIFLIGITTAYSTDCETRIKNANNLYEKLRLAHNESNQIYRAAIKLLIANNYEMSAESCNKFFDAYLLYKKAERISTDTWLTFSLVVQNCHVHSTTKERFSKVEEMGKTIEEFKEKSRVFVYEHCSEFLE